MTQQPMTQHTMTQNTMILRPMTRRPITQHAFPAGGIQLCRCFCSRFKAAAGTDLTIPPQRPAEAQTLPEAPTHE